MNVGEARRRKRDQDGGSLGRKVRATSSHLQRLLWTAITLNTFSSQNIT